MTVPSVVAGSNPTAVATCSVDDAVAAQVGVARAARLA